MTPYGYRIEYGTAVADPNESPRLLRLFELYVSGSSIESAARAAGVTRAISNCSAILRNEIYLGTDFYPALVPQTLFEQAQSERARRCRPKRKRQKKPVVIPTRFRWIPFDGTSPQDLYNMIRTSSIQPNTTSQI